MAMLTGSSYTGYEVVSTHEVSKCLTKSLKCRLHLIYFHK